MPTNNILFGQIDCVVTQDAKPPEDLAEMVAIEARKIAEALGIIQKTAPGVNVTLNVKGIDVAIRLVQYKIPRQGNNSDAAYSISVFAPREANEFGLLRALQSLNYRTSQLG